MHLVSDLLNKLRWVKRWFYIKRYRLRNVHPKFLATSRLGGVSKDVVAGAYSYIGPDCKIYPNVTIGKYTMLANNVSVIGGDHNFRIAGIPSVFAGRDPMKSTIIGDDVWIGANSIIMVGVRIGNGAIIAAGSVVTKDVEPYGVYAGVPARKIKARFTQTEIELHEKMLSRPANELSYLESRLVHGNDSR